LEKFRPGCYSQQTQWWLAILPGNDDEKVQKSIEFCQTLKNEEYSQCFKGLAEHLGFHIKWQVKRIPVLCSLFPKDLYNSCMINAAHVFKYAKYANEALELCKKLPDLQSTECLNKIKSST
jgi:hypothetical protein